MTANVLPYRLAEVTALLPLLHVKPGPTTVAVFGPLSGLMAAEVLKWRDTVAVLTLAPIPGVNDRRVRVVEKLEPASCDAILLSPEHLPQPPILATLKPGGVIQVLTLDADKARAQAGTLRALVGPTTPWREYLPQLCWGAMACLGGSCKRFRQPPGGAKRLTAQYIPCLFTFGKDELPLVFSSGPSTLKPA
jgi:hypothetical protein